MVGIALTYTGLVGLRALDQHRTNRWQLSRPDEQNDIGRTTFVNFGPTKLPTNCQRWSSVDALPKIIFTWLIPMIIGQKDETYILVVVVSV